MNSRHAPHPVLRIAAHGAVYGVALTMLLPFVWMVVTSLKTDQEALGTTFSLWPRE